MAFVLGQYNKNINVGDDSIFMTLITDGTVGRKAVRSDSGVSGNAIQFYNECIKVDTSFINENNYYFHGKIKRMRTSQTFYIKLVNYSDSSNDEQYIKTITVGGGDPHDWVDIEFIFSPYATFDSLLFELQRITEDYTQEIRYPIIIYEELSLINDIIPTKIKPGVGLVKIGVQSRPGLIMCINGEEIRTSRTGIYELKNGLMTIYFFSVVSAASEITTILGDTMTEITAEWDLADSLPTAIEQQEAKAAIGSRCLFSAPKDRTIDSFTLDYIYREE